MIFGHFAVGVGGEKFRENNLIGIRAAHGEGVADDSPLRFAIETENFAKIMHEASEHHPIRVAVFANGFGRLKEMLNLRQVGIGIAIVDQRVEVLGLVPNALQPFCSAPYWAFFCKTKSTVWFR